MYMYCIEEWLLVCCRGHGWTGSLTQLMTTHTCGHCTPLPLSCRLSSVLPSVCDQRLVTWSLMYRVYMYVCVCVHERQGMFSGEHYVSSLVLFSFADHRDVTKRRRRSIIQPLHSK